MKRITAIIALMSFLCGQVFSQQWAESNTQRSTSNWLQGSPRSSGGLIGDGENPSGELTHGSAPVGALPVAGILLLAGGYALVQKRKEKSTIHKIHNL